MTFQRVMRLLVIAFIAFVVVVTALPAFADEGHGHNHHGGGDVTSDIVLDSRNSVSNSVRDSSSTLALGAGDVDIAQCYRSWSVILYQDSKPNLLCVAEALDAKGLHEAAAKMRCSVKAVSKVFDSYDQCIALNTVTGTIKNLTVTEEILSDHEEDEEMFHVEQQEMYADLQASIENLKQKQQQDEAARKRAAREQQQKDQQRRDYAQQTLEDLEQWK